MAFILFIFIIFPCHCAVYMYKIMILQKPLSQFPPNFVLIYCWNVIDSLFKWLCSIDCQAHIFFFKTKNCSNDDLFISCDDRIGKMLHNICISAVVMSLRWASRGPWASCLLCQSQKWQMTFCFFFVFFFLFFRKNKSCHLMWIICLTNDSHDMPYLLLSEKWEFYLLQFCMVHLRLP